MSGIIGQEPFGKSGIIGKFTSKGIEDKAAERSIEIESAGDVKVHANLQQKSGLMGFHMYGSSTDQSLTQIQITHMTSGSGNCGGRHHRFRWINGNTAIPHIKNWDSTSGYSAGWSAGWNWSTSGTKVMGISTISGEQNELICTDFWTMVWNSTSNVFQGISTGWPAAADQHVLMYFEYNQVICVVPGSETLIDSSSSVKVAKAF